MMHAPLPPLRLASLLRGRPLPITMHDAGTVRLLLECVPSLRHPERKTLHGALLFLDGKLAHGEGAMVQLLADNEIVSEGIVTAFGSFLFDNISAGSYRLALRLPTRSVVIEGIEIA